MSVERAREVRRAMMTSAEAFSDEQAANVPTLYPAWVVGEAVNETHRRFYAEDGKLYKCRQPHTTQADWTPDKTPALWAVIDVAHAGTISDPIPASRGMDYEYGKYYLDPEDGKTYLCQRAGEAAGGIINLQHLPHELVGHYFEVAV